MKERPILFSAPMVRALLNDSKTQTRRVVKPFPAADQRLRKITGSSGFIYVMDEVGLKLPELRRIRWDCPHGQPGDKLWVRETWQTHCELDGITPRDLPNDLHIQYPATYDGWVSKRRQSIHMPRWASRITLEITGVRVERLQDISEADAIAEGLTPAQTDYMRKYAPEKFGYLGQRIGSCCEPRLAYKQLWNSINGPDSWDANPWVWVLEFRRVQP